MRSRHNVRYTPSQGLPTFATQAEKDDILAALDDLIEFSASLGEFSTTKRAKARRRKVSGVVVGS